MKKAFPYQQVGKRPCTSAATIWRSSWPCAIPPEKFRSITDYLTKTNP